MNVVFLDYDGVVNTPMWDEAGKRCTFGYPMDNKVNNFQCVQWVSEFCEKYGYSIVVSSTWRFDKNYIDCLKNGGLRDGIEVIGKTPSCSSVRGDEIQKFLDEHPEIENFLIFDDDDDMGDLADHLIQTNPNYGFGCDEFAKAERCHQQMCNKKMISVE